MTLLEDPPVATDTVVSAPSVATAQPSAWRLALRLARRETRRRPGRTVLASLLIAVPVMAMTMGSVVARSESGGWAAQFERRYGGADIAVDPSQFAFSSDGEAAAPAVPAGTVVSDYLWIYTQVTTTDADAPFAYVAVTDIDLDDPITGSPIEVIEGRSPNVGEMLIPANLADELNVGIGDDVTFERPSGTWTVSGISRVRDSYYNDAIVIPGFDRSRIAENYGQIVTMYDLPADVSPVATQQLAAELGGMTRFADPYDFGTDVTRGMAWGWVAGALALFAVGIIVAAAFATSARRQLVTIGQLTSNGATESTIRRTLALQGTWTGLCGAAFGVAVGLASLPVVKPVIEQKILQHDVAPFRFNAVDLIVIALTATIAGTLAAAVPARSASKIPVMSALAGRRPLGALPTWLVPTGLLLLAAGLGLVAVASLGTQGAANSSASNDVWALLIVLGVVGVVSGMCCVSPLLIERIGRLGRRSSLSWRLALRSLARSRTRSSAVVAAIAVAVGGSVAAGAIAETTIREDVAGWNATVPDDAIVLDAIANQEGLYEDGSEATVDFEALPPAPLPDDLLDQILAIAPGATVTPIRIATIDPQPYNTQTGAGIWPDGQGLRVADQGLIDILGLSDADVQALDDTGSLKPLGRYELANPGAAIEEFDSTSTNDGQTLQYDGPDGVIEVNVTPATSPYRYDYAGWNTAIVTEAYAQELGFEIVERGVIVRTPDALTIAQRDAIVQLQQSRYSQQYDAFVEPGDAPRLIEVPVADEEWNITFDEPRWRSGAGSGLWVARLVILGAVVLISLLVVSIGLALAAAEGRDERNVLAVVGATPASMRRQASARAAVLALSGIALGIPTGFLPAWVLYSVLNTNNSISLEPLRFPWLVVAALLVVVPVLVAGAAWVGSGVGQRFRPVSPTRQD